MSSLKAVIWDVQHGHAVYLKTPNQNIVIDLGVGSFADSGKDFSPLLHLKNKYGVDRLDAVVITHPHGDHLYDIGNFDALSPRALWRPRHLSDSDIEKGNVSADASYVRKYLELNARYTEPLKPGEDATKPGNNGGVDFTIFTPRTSSTSNLNNHSVVTLATFLGMKLLIPGDNEEASWNELLKDSRFTSAAGDTDILLAPHHGRQAGFSGPLMDLLNPRLTIVSDGAETDTSAVNRYSSKTRGWTVHMRNGTDEERKCLTTRSDGVITIDFGGDSLSNRSISVHAG